MCVVMTAPAAGCLTRAMRSALDRGARMVAGRGRYTLWTGDVGLAIYLWDCITGQPRFPTIDVF